MQQGSGPASREAHNLKNWVRFPALLPFLLFVLMPFAAHATDVQITCTPPTTFANGSTIPAGTAISYRFFGALQGQTKTLLNGTARTTCANTWASAPAGTVCATVTAIIAGVESDPSAESCIAIAAPKPSAPGAPTLTLAAVTPTVFTLVKTKDRLAALPIGTVPVGTPCDSTQPVLGLYVVPVASVTWSGNARTLAVLASCG